MSNPFVTKLESVVPLCAADRAALMAACMDVRELPADRYIARQGERPRYVHLILEGWAARYELLADGSRQITAILVPGDLCDQHVTVLGEMDHSICTLTPAKVAYLPNGQLEAVARDRPDVARALWWSTLVDEAILRAWIVSNGRRDAHGAVSHLLCELHARIRNVGLVGDHHFELPLTQEEIADCVGLTPVHVNRILKRLRAEGLLRLGRGILEIPDVARLRAAADFNPAYLHYGEARRRAVTGEESRSFPPADAATA